MRQFFSRLKNRFTVLGKNIFQQQLDTFLRNLPQQRQDKHHLVPTVICVGEQTGYWLEVLSRFGAPLFSQPIKKERYITSCFALQGEEVVHFLSAWPKNGEVERQLSAFYQQFAQQSSLTLLNRVTPALLSNKDELRRACYHNATIQNHLHFRQCEWRWVLTEASEFAGLKEYVKYCHANQLPLSLTLGSADVIQKQLQDLEEQRKKCLVECDEDTFLTIITGVSVLIRQIGQMKIGLASAGIGSDAGIMKYHFADPELGLSDSTEQDAFNRDSSNRDSSNRDSSSWDASEQPASERDADTGAVPPLH